MTYVKCAKLMLWMYTHSLKIVLAWGTTFMLIWAPNWAQKWFPTTGAIFKIIQAPQILVLIFFPHMNDVMEGYYNLISYYFQACIDKVDLIESPLIGEHIAKLPNYVKYPCAQQWVWPLSPTFLWRYWT